ncbi:cadherin domain-containing protein, partial [Azotobacter beijerinckii]
SAPDSGETLTVTAVTQPAVGGTVSLSGGVVSFTPTANWNGTASFTYTLGDGNGGSDTATVNVTVTPVDDAPSFSIGDGKVTLDISALYDGANAVAMQADGKILVAGYSNAGYGAGDIALLRYNADGSLDTSFGSAGMVIADIDGGDDFAYRMIVLADGRILLAGTAGVDGTSDFALLCFNADGTPDSGFGTGGIVTTPIGAGNDQAYGMTVQADGKILLAGSSYQGGNQAFALVRYNADGSLDTSFGVSGKIITDLGLSHDYAFSVNVQADGSILVAGHNTTDFVLLRYDSNGVLDSSFGTGGVVTTNFGSGDSAFDMTLQADGRILLAGSSNGDFALARYNADGSLDTSFNGDGMLTTSLGSWDGANAVTVQTDGRILLSGSSDGHFALVRYNSDGSLDTSFSGDGKLTTSIDPYAWESGYSTLVQPDGRILLVGNSGSSLALLRFNTDGSLDTSFDPVSTLGGTLSFTESGPAVVLDTNVAISDAELDALGGGLGNYNGASLTITRNGGASVEDLFSASGTLGALTQGAALTVGGTTIGTVTSNSSGTLQLSFNSNATTALVNEALRQIAYSNNSDTPPTAVQLDWSLSDGNTDGAQGAGGEQSASGSVTVNITAVNDAPTASDDSVSTAEDTPVVLGVSDFGTFADVEGDSLVKVMITSLETRGALQLFDGTSWTDVTLNQEISRADLDAGHLRFVPAANDNGTPYTTVGFKVSDGTDYSVSAYTLTVSVTAVNDAPLASGNVSLPAVAEDTASPAGATVATLFSASFDDSTDQVAGGSSADSLAGIAITGYSEDTSAGVWQYSTDSGSSWTDLPSISGDSSALTLQASDLLRFVPAANYNGAAPDLTVRLIDSSTSVASAATLDVSSNGGTAAISAGTVTLSTSVSEVDDPTAVSGGTSGSGDEDGGAITGTLAAGDADGLSDGSVFSIAAGDAPAHGTASIDPASGAWTYTPAADYYGTDRFTVTLTDDLGHTTTQVIALTVAAVADIADDSFSTNEDTPLVIGTASLLGNDSFEGTPVVSGVGSAAHGSVSLSGGTVTYTPNANYHGSDSFTYTVTSGGVTETTTVNVTQTNLNDHPVLLSDSDTAANSVAENASNGTVVGVTALGQDADAGTTLTYRLTDSAGGRFAIDASTGVVTVADGSLLDYEAASSHTITVQALSSDGSTTSAAFVIAVGNLDDHPATLVDGNAATNAVAENASNGTVVGVTALGQDADAGTTLTYRLTDSAGGRFAIDATSGVVTVADGSLLDYEAAARHSIAVLATSSDGSTTTASFVIAVGNLDDNAPLLGVDTPSVSLAENASAGPIATATASDADGDIPTYSLTGTVPTDGSGNPLFAIDSTTGAISLTAAGAAVLDYETTPRYTLTVKASDGAHDSNLATVTVDLTNLDDHPVLLSDGDAAANSVAENASNGTVVGVTALGQDADAGTTLTYRLTDSAGGRFAIDASTGVVTVADGSLLDYESASSHTLTVLATSSDGSTTTADFVIAVTDLDEVAPVVTISSLPPTADNTQALSGTVDDPSATIIVTVDGVDYTATNNGDGTWTLADDTLPPLADGVSSVTVRAVDAAGNTGNASGSVEVDTTAPVVLIDVDPITSDDVVNAAEAAGNISVTGNISGDASIGDSVSLLVNGTRYTGSVIDLGDGTLGFAIAVAGSDLAADTSLTTTVSGSDAAGNGYNAATTSTHTTKLSTGATISVDLVTADDILNAVEATGNVEVTGTVGGDAAVGDTVSLVVNGITYRGSVVDLGNGELGFSIAVAGSDLAADTGFEASVSGSDAAGNPFSSSVLAHHAVDVGAPLVETGQTFIYGENQAAGAVLGSVAASDASGISDYRFANGTRVSDDGYFSIDSSGRISLTEFGAAAAANDFETLPNTFTPSVQAGDAAGNWSTAVAVTLQVADQHEGDPVPSIILPVGDSNAGLLEDPTLEAYQPSSATSATFVPLLRGLDPQVFVLPMLKATLHDTSAAADKNKDMPAITRSLEQEPLIDYELYVLPILERLRDAVTTPAQPANGITASAFAPARTLLPDYVNDSAPEEPAEQPAASGEESQAPAEKPQEAPRTPAPTAAAQPIARSSFSDQLKRAAGQRNTQLAAEALQEALAKAPSATPPRIQRHGA